MLDFLLQNWELIGSFLLVLFVTLFKLKLNSSQETAIETLWLEIKPLIEAFTDKEEVKKLACDKIELSPELNKIKTKIDTTAGYSTKEIVSVLVDNHELIKDVGKGAYKLLKGVKKIF